MNSENNLIFFDKEGNSLNFKWDSSTEKWSGDIMFHHNSSDTFKTQALYTFEKVPSIQYELPGDLYLDKFQLFNEFGLDIIGANYYNEPITKIEPVNINSDFYSKWIYGINIEKKFPIGTDIRFDQAFLEFVDPHRIYTVIKTKKGAIMILSDQDNNLFNINFPPLVTNDPNTYTNITISGVNSIGFYNYVDANTDEVYSAWSQPNFYTKVYDGRKLNIINSDKNDGVYTIKNKDLFDKKFYKYEVSNLPYGEKLWIELKLKTDLPVIYNGIITFDQYRVYFPGGVPAVLKPGVQFKVPESVNYPDSFITVDSIPKWESFNSNRYYATQSQVLYNNKIYQCIQGYTHSANSLVLPTDATYWGSPTFVPVLENLIYEYMIGLNVYLTNNVLYYDMDWTQGEYGPSYSVTNKNITLASAANKYAEEFKLFNIDLYYSGGKLISELIYPSKYVEVNYYFNQLSATYSIGSTNQVVEFVVETEEPVKKELNYNTNSNHQWDIVFTDIDEYGIKVNVNKMPYDADVNWVYVGPNVDMEKTIDATLRDWLLLHFARLASVGIIADLEYTGSIPSIYYNTIRLKSEYPNVPFTFDVKVGTTANYYIPQTDVLFYDLGPVLSLKINDKEYQVMTDYSSPQVPNIPSTVQKWIDEYSNLLDDYGIYAKNSNNLLSFSVKQQDKRFVLSVNIGKTGLPNELYYKVTKRWKGKLGTMITSNEVILNSVIGGTNLNDSFKAAGFATGMVFSVNNTPYAFNNQEYNILTMDAGRLNLSYQGPFWGNTGSSTCYTSPFTVLAYSLGFGSTACPPPEPPISGTNSGSGAFATASFGGGFSLYYSSENDYNLLNIPGTTGMVDLVHCPYNQTIWALGDNISIYDSVAGISLSTLILTGNTQSVAIKFNWINNYIYALTKTKLHKIDPLTYGIVTTFNLTANAYDMTLNENNGDIYVSYYNANKVDIFTTTNTLFTVSTSANTFKLLYNVFENDIYATQDNNNVVRIDGSTRTLQTYYSISGLTHYLYYDPSGYDVYGFGTTLFKINSGTLTTIPTITSGTYNSIVFNNILNSLYVSNNSGNLYKLDTSDNVNFTMLVGNYGYLGFNPYDGDVYIASASASNVQIHDPNNGLAKSNIAISSPMKKLIYNPDRKSMWGILPTTNSVTEVGVIVNSQVQLMPIQPVSIGDQQGSLSEAPRASTWISSREYIRYPKENYSDDVAVEYIWKWEDDQTPEMFMYDFSGELLEKTGVYAYTGPKPLKNIVLSDTPNRNLEYVGLDEAQQTIFSTIPKSLPYLDSELTTILPEPMEIFIGFNSKQEGVTKSKLKLYKRQDISFTILPDGFNNNLISFEFKSDSITGEQWGEINLDYLSTDMFIDRGLKPGQLIEITIEDNVNKKNQWIPLNSGKIFKIRNVYHRSIIVDFIDDVIENEINIISDYPTLTKTTYLTTMFKVVDKEIGAFTIVGQTEIEDIRYEINLNNVGKNITADDIYIFKEYDINESGVDWNFLNKKRKEMLLVKNEIFPYVGSYKALINAINYFGYNDLELYEYYRNININSPDFDKLRKIEIPDIFDNTVEGWTENDFISHTLPNENYEETNLFNLTYRITDKEGNYILSYSLMEVIIKLQGLKKWLHRNVVPLTHEILDITGQTDFVTDYNVSIIHRDAMHFNTKDTMTPFDFNINEAYLMPITSGSTVYNVIVSFTHSSIGTVPDFYGVKIRTYKTYPEWFPFTTYNNGDFVTYYGKIYQSVQSNNKLNNPRKYDATENWESSKIYTFGQYVRFNEEIYRMSATSSGTQSGNPYLETSEWLNVTEWKTVDMVPVQTIKEYRSGIKDMSFTIDSNIDPFIVVEVTCDNGYGQNFTMKKNYEVRSNKDIQPSNYSYESIGPFIPLNI